MGTFIPHSSTLSRTLFFLKENGSLTPEQKRVHWQVRDSCCESSVIGMYGSQLKETLYYYMSLLTH